MKLGIQKQIAAETGLSGAFISYVLSGKKRPSWHVAKRLAAATNTKPELWLEGTPEQIKAALSAEPDRRSGEDRRQQKRRTAA